MNPTHVHYPLSTTPRAIVAGSVETPTYTPSDMRTRVAIGLGVGLVLGAFVGWVVNEHTR